MLGHHGGRNGLGRYAKALLTPPTRFLSLLIQNKPDHSHCSSVSATQPDRGDVWTKTCAGAVRSIFNSVFFCLFQICVTCLDPMVMAGDSKICADIAGCDFEVFDSSRIAATILDDVVLVCLTPLPPQCFQKSRSIPHLPCPHIWQCSPPTQPCFVCVMQLQQHWLRSGSIVP